MVTPPTVDPVAQELAPLRGGFSFNGSKMEEYVKLRLQGSRQDQAQLVWTNTIADGPSHGTKGVPMKSA